MHKALNPTHIAPPYKNRYSHAVEVSAGSRMLFISGTVGVKPDGTVPAEFAALDGGSGPGGGKIAVSERMNP